MNLGVSSPMKNKEEYWPKDTVLTQPGKTTRLPARSRDIWVVDRFDISLEKVSESNSLDARRKVDFPALYIMSNEKGACMEKERFSRARYERKRMRKRKGAYMEKEEPFHS